MKIIIQIPTSCKIILDTRREKVKTNAFPVKLRIINNRIVKDFTMVFDLKEHEFNNLNSSQIGGELRGVRKQIKKTEKAAQDFILQAKPFSFIDFETRFISIHSVFKKRKSFNVNRNRLQLEEFDYSPYLKRFPLFYEEHSRPQCISGVFLFYIKKLLREERIGNALNYQSTYNSLCTFKGNVLFSEITPWFLHRYEQWMLSRNRTIGTVGIKLVPLRAIFNEAIALGLINRENCYPFGKHKYIIPKAKNVKKAIGMDEISRIYYYNIDDPEEKKARDYWIFSYYANGMNPIDIANLRFKNMDGDFFVFIRTKTKLITKADPRPISVYINEDMRDTIQRLRNVNNDPDNYVFPILKTEMTPIEKYYAIRSFTRFINDRMKIIGSRLGIARKLTTIVTRHTFSTQLKRSGASTEFIQEALGHASKKTTEYYLDSFENDVKKKFAYALAGFKK